MEVRQTPLPGVMLIQPKAHKDKRGFFLEMFRSNSYSKNGTPKEFIQDNMSRSAKGALRGLHYQLNYPQGKLVSVIRGAVFDVAVDIRYESETFGQWYGALLSDENHHQLYIPPGYAHGFVVMSDVADFYYKCTEYYHPEDEMGIRWDDPGLSINWPIQYPIVSKKDSELPMLSEISANHLPGGNSH